VELRNVLTIARAAHEAWFIKPDMGLTLFEAYKDKSLFQNRAEDKKFVAGNIVTADSSNDSFYQNYYIRYGWPYFLNTDGTKSVFLGNSKMPYGILDGAIVVCQVLDVIMKDDYCGSPGTASMKACLETALSISSLAGVILHINSPGGAVSGVPQFSEFLSTIEMPTVAFVEEMACSAGYYIACAADTIIASDRQDQVGSIGVMIQIVDSNGMVEAKGGKVHTVYSTLSPEKNGEFNAMLKGDYKPVQTNLLDPLATRFIETVQSNRPKIDKAAFKGGTYFAENALADSVGLVDSIGTFQDAIQYIRSSSGTSNSVVLPSSNSQSNMKLTFKSAYAAFASFLGITPTSSSESVTVEMTEAHAEKLNTALLERDSLSASVAGLQSSLAAKETELAAATAELQTVKAANAILAKDLATAKEIALGKPTAIVGGEDSQPKAPVELKPWEVAANKALGYSE
jgi:protease-4